MSFRFEDPPSALRLDDLVGMGRPVVQMGVGPTPLPPEVQRAVHLSGDHLGKEMGRVIEGIQAMGQYVFQTDTSYILGTTSSASGAMKMGLDGVLWPGRRALVLSNGTFSDRLVMLARMTGAEVRVVRVPDGDDVPYGLAQEAIDAFSPHVVALVHGETSTGVLNVDLVPICRAAKRAGALTVVDCVVTLSVCEFFMDAWGIDVAMTGGQKGLASMAGVALIAFSREAWGVVERNPRLVVPELGDKRADWTNLVWYFNPLVAWNFWGPKHGYHYTANVPGFYGLYAAMWLICQERLQARWERQARHSLALQCGFEAAGIRLFTPEDRRLQAAVALALPRGVQSAAWKERCREEERYAVAGAFVPGVGVRVGQMGEQCQNVLVLGVIAAVCITADRIGKEAGAMDGSEIHIARGWEAAGHVLINGTVRTPSAQRLLDNAGQRVSEVA